jgi:hypothetical protein
MDSNPQKRQSTSDSGPPPKKFKGAPELPGDYSDAVRKKYQSASRTGQACDRCKVRRDRACQEPGKRPFTPYPSPMGSRNDIAPSKHDVFSHYKPLGGIMAELPQIPGCFNLFRLQIFDAESPSVSLLLLTNTSAVYRSGRCDAMQTQLVARLVNRRICDASPPIESLDALQREAKQIDWKLSLWP